MSQDRNILVTAVGALTAVEVLRILKNSSYRVTGIDCDINAANKEKCDSFFISPNAEHEKDYLDFILKLCKIESIDTIIPISTSEVKVLSSNKTLLKKEGIKYELSPRESIKRVINKNNLYLDCIELDIPVPCFHRVTNLQEYEKAHLKIKETYDVCLKPSQGEGGRGFRKVKDTSLQEILESKASVNISHEEFKKCITDKTIDFLCMEYLEGQEYSVDVLAKNGNAEIILPRTRDLIIDGFSHKCTFVKNHYIEEYCKKLVQRFNLNGIVGFQFKEDKNKNVKLLECNPRIQGGTCLSNKLGFNFIDLYLQLCNNAYSVANLESYRSRCESLIGVQVSR